MESDQDELTTMGGNAGGPGYITQQVDKCLMTFPSDRSDDELKVLVKFTETVSALKQLPVAMRLAMCRVMLLAKVQDQHPGTVIIEDGTQLDSWGVIVKGRVEVDRGQGKDALILKPGDGFGIMGQENETQEGQMLALEEDCQFLCIKQEDYCEILNNKDFNQIREERNGQVVLVKQVRRIEGTPSKHIEVVLTGTPRVLVEQLMDDITDSDPGFIEDLLLGHRIFKDYTSTDILRQLLEWFDNEQFNKKKVSKIVLLWVNNHFQDFDLCTEMMVLLESLKGKLRAADMLGEVNLLEITCKTMAIPRTVTVQRNSRDDKLDFQLIDSEGQVFVKSVVEGSNVSYQGLKWGDEVFEVNGIEVKSAEKAKEIINRETIGKTNLQIKVKYNREDFGNIGIDPTSRSSQELRHSGGFATPEHHQSTLKRRKTKFFPDIFRKKQQNNQCQMGEDSPDTNDQKFESSLKVYRSDQTFRHLLVSKQTTAKDVICQGLKEFGVNETSKNYALYLVGPVKQQRIFETMDNLERRLSVATRFYIKNLATDKQLISEEVRQELEAENQVNLLTIDAEITAWVLTVLDFEVFRQIQQTEYVDYLFEVTSKIGTKNFDEFSVLVNSETFWVITELLSESDISKRAKIIKKFICIAKACKEIQNFNSMFAITAGLTHFSISRLKKTWEMVSPRAKTCLSDLLLLNDPSNNFRNYRNMMGTEKVKPPIIPIYPILTHDLAFINFGNKTLIDGLFNFKKIRIVGREIRKLGRMSSAPLRDVPEGVSILLGSLQGDVIARNMYGLINLDARQTFDDTQEARRVQAYLDKKPVIIDEKELYQMSLKEEPQAGRKAPIKPPTTPEHTSLSAVQSSPPNPSATMRKRTMSIISRASTLSVSVFANKPNMESAPGSPSISKKPIRSASNISLNRRNSLKRSPSEATLSELSSSSPDKTSERPFPVRKLSIPEDSTISTIIPDRKSDPHPIRKLSGSLTNRSSDSSLTSTLDEADGFDVDTEETALARRRSVKAVQGLFQHARKSATLSRGTVPLNFDVCNIDEDISENISEDDVPELT